MVSPRVIFLSDIQECARTLSVVYIPIVRSGGRQGGKVKRHGNNVSKCMCIVIAVKRASYIALNWTFTY